MTRRRLLFRLLAGRRAQAVALLLLSTILGLASGVVSSWRSAATAAEVQSVTSAYANFAYALQPQSPEATRLLTRSAGLLPVWDWSGEASTAAALSDVQVRSAAPVAARYGVLRTGTFPQQASEVAVTTRLAQALRLAKGQHVRFTGDGPGARRELTVVGTFDDPADRAALRGVVGASGDPNKAALFLTNRDVRRDSTLLPALTDRDIAIRTVQRLAAVSAASSTHSLNAVLAPLAPALVAVAAFLLALAVVGLRRQNAGTATALQAAGLPGPATTRLLLAAVLLPIVLGAVLGQTTATALMNILRDVPAAVLGQVWVGLDAPLGAQGRYVLVLPLIVLAIVAADARTARLLGWRPAAAVSDVTGTVLVLAGSGLYVLVYFQLLAVLWATLAGATLTVGALLLTRRIGAAGSTPAVGKVIRNNSEMRLALSAVLVLVSFGSGLLASRTIAAGDLSQRSTFQVQPPGSFVIYRVNDTARVRIADAYRRLGAPSPVTIAIPNERSRQVRATSPGLVACTAERRVTRTDVALDTCLVEGTNVPINAVGLSGATDGAAVEADPALVAHGRVGLLTIMAGSPDIVDTAEEPATAQPLLGGNLLGVVLPSGSPVARRYGLVPSGSSYLVLPGFAALTAQEQARARAVVRVEGGTAEVSEPPEDVTGTRRLVARTITATGTGFGLCVLASGVLSYLTLSRVLRIDLGLLGVASRQRTAIGFRTFAPLVAVQLLVGPCVLLTSWFQAGREGDLGVAESLLPCAAVAAGAVLAGLLFRRAPRPGAT